MIIKQFRVAGTAVISLLVSTTFYGQANKAATDYLNLPGPIAFDSKSYSLSWTSHPAPNYYKQEYLVKGDNVAKFNTMLLVELVTGNEQVKAVAEAKIAELKKLKETNPMVNYESFNNPATGEYMIDFLLSQNNADGSAGILERNVYRYLPFTGKDKKKGIILFGVSTRRYGDKVKPFLISLKAKKSELVNKVAEFKLPALVISK